MRAVTLSKAQEYRELARECRKLAGTVSTDEGRTTPPSPGSEQPVVQQQQQVQPKDENKDD
jgi:hypothetical protein